MLATSARPQEGRRVTNPVTQNTVAEAGTSPEGLIAMLDRFADAWNAHDLDALVSYMTEDAVFESSTGTEVEGTRWVGRDAVRAGFGKVLSSYPDVQFEKRGHFVAGDRGVSEWVFRGTRLDGTRVEVYGCDLFTFRDGRILRKNSFLKNRVS
jgi:uncharacterized protein (TIGR02246 family)